MHLQFQVPDVVELAPVLPRFQAVESLTLDGQDGSNPGETTPLLDALLVRRAALPHCTRPLLTYLPSITAASHMQIVVASQVARCPFDLFDLWSKTLTSVTQGSHCMLCSIDC